MRCLIFFTILSYFSVSGARTSCESLSRKLRELAKVQTSLNDPFAKTTDRYQVVSYVKQNRLKKFRPVIGPTEPLDVGDDALLNESVKAYDRVGQLGRFEYSIDPKAPNRMNIDLVEVKARGRNRGLSEAMFARVLNAHPEVTEVKTFMMDLNSEIIKKRLRAGLDCELALLGSPAGLMRIKFGFTRLIRATCDPEGDGGRGTFTLIQGR